MPTMSSSADSSHSRLVGSLHDRIVKTLPYVRSYVLKDGRLFLSLMADGGVYEFEPAH